MQQGAWLATGGYAALLLAWMMIKSPEAEAVKDSVKGLWLGMASGALMFLGATAVAVALGLLKLLP